MKKVVRYNGNKVLASSPITAADDEIDADEFLAEDPDMGGPDAEYGAEGDLGDQIDDLAEGVEDIQDQLDDVEEDDVSIEIENNIDGSLIAECDTCNGIFISAMRQSDQQVDRISGVCPLCNKETDQILKWVVKKLEYDI